jgi:hypothetical protein
MTTLTDDLAQELLIKYEPILIFDSDNKVLPMDTEPFVRQCSLWETPRASISFQKPKMIKDWGSLTRQDLARYRSPAKSVYYLYFAKLDEATAQAMQRQGITTTTGAIIEHGLKQYAALPADDRQSTYHGRAFYSGDYLALQYWFFYALNDFKTSHGGINDHEGDWEGVTLFLPKEQQTPAAAAIAADTWLPTRLLAAAHHGAEAAGWDEVERDGDHPIFYIARGSHAAYYQTGNPFPDRADGKGEKVGPGGSKGWKRIIFPVEGPPDWVTNFDGAWGYYSRDALGGYNGPGGLTQTIKYSLLGGLSHEPRATWVDPVGEANLA